MSGKASGKGGGKGAAGKADAAAWLAVGASMIGALMATLDISITNAALPKIQGEIGANGTEGTWVSTAYLTAEIVAIALAGFFERLFGLRRFLLICTVGFVGFSAVCGISTSLGQMIFGRVGQGLTGGALIPTALSVVATRLPPGQQASGVALFGVSSLLGPVLGPVIGGYLAESLSWHYGFFINLPIGIVLIGLLIIGLPSSKADTGVLRQADWLGILGLAMGLGALTVVLEEGQRERWFESGFINTLSAVSAVGFVLLAAGQLTARRPVIALSLLRDRAFAGTIVMTMAIGSGLYGVLYLIPQFLADIPDYNSFQSGTIAMISGIPVVMMMPFFPKLVRVLDVRIAVALGLGLFGAGCLLDRTLTADSGGGAFVLPQLMRGFGMFFSMVFLNQSATRSAPKALAPDAAGLFNAARNLGGSFGLAMISTMQDRRAWLYRDRVTESLPANSVAAQDYMRQLEGVGQTGDPVGGMMAATQQLTNQIAEQATVLTYGDLFWLFGVIILGMIPLVLVLKPLPKVVESSA